MSDKAQTRPKATEPAADRHLRHIRNLLALLIAVVFGAWLDISQAITHGGSFFWGG